MKKLPINANLRSIISGIVHHDEFARDIPEEFRVKEVTLDNETPKEILIANLTCCKNYHIEDDSIITIVDKTKEEIDEMLEENLYSFNYSLKELKQKIENSEKNKEQVKSFLFLNNLLWIEKEMKHVKI